MNEQVRNHVVGKKHYRAFRITRDQLTMESEKIPMTFSSGRPVLRWWGVEILSHDKNHIRMDRWKSGAPFLKDHITTDQRGIIEEGDCADGMMIGKVRMSANPPGQELKRDIVDGIRPYTSIGYDIHSIRELREEEMEDEVKTLCLENKCAAYMVEDWEPLEGSSVWLGADPTVGRRGADYFDGEKEEKIVELLRKLNEEKQERDNKQPTIHISKKEDTMSDKTPEALEAERVAEIRSIQEKFGSRIKGGAEKMRQLAEDAITLKIPAEQFRGDTFMRVNDDRPIQNDPASLGLSEREKKEYSVCRAILVAAGKIKPDAAKLELELSDEVARRAEVATKGIYIPHDVVISAQLRRAMSRRDQTTASTAVGGALVATDNMGDRFIDILRNRMVGAKAGVTYMYGLRDSITIPKKTAGSTFAFGSSTSESSLTFDQVSLSPKTGGTYVDYDYKLLLQSNPSIEAVVRRDLLDGAAIGGDAAILHGAGGTAPTGVANVSGVGSVDGTAIGRSGKLEFETDVAEANGDVENMKYILRPTARQILKERAEVANYPKFLMDDDGYMNGYPSLVSNQANAGYVFFGDWSTVLVGIYGGIELLPDALTQATSFLFRMHVRMAMDVAVQIPGKLTVCSNLS